MPGGSYLMCNYGPEYQDTACCLTKVTPHCVVLAKATIFRTDAVLRHAAPHRNRGLGKIKNLVSVGR